MAADQGVRSGEMGPLKYHSTSSPGARGVRGVARTDCLPVTPASQGISILMLQVWVRSFPGSARSRRRYGFCPGKRIAPDTYNVIPSISRLLFFRNPARSWRYLIALVYLTPVPSIKARDVIESLSPCLTYKAPGPAPRVCCSL